MHYTSVHTFFIPFPSHPPLFFFCIFSCFTVTDILFLLPDLKDVLALEFKILEYLFRYCVFMLQTLFNRFSSNILVLQVLPDDPKPQQRFVTALRSAG